MFLDILPIQLTSPLKNVVQKFSFYSTSAEDIYPYNDFIHSYELRGLSILARSCVRRRLKCWCSLHHVDTSCGWPPPACLHSSRATDYNTYNWIRYCGSSNNPKAKQHSNTKSLSNHFFIQKMSQYFRYHDLKFFRGHQQKTTNNLKRFNVIMHPITWFYSKLNCFWSFA